MTDTKQMVSTGINGLNRMINTLFIGDNVIWYDDAGSLAAPFCHRFIKASREENKSIIYVSFDRSPKNLIEKLGSLAENQQLTILDCFTNGKGDKAQIFNKFYEKDGAQWPYQVIKVTHPENPQAVADAILGLHKHLTGDVRFVFESLTGMADLWGGDNLILKFYSHTCPKLYELDTIAYWIIEKKAHSDRLKAHINQIAQVALSLSIDQGKTKIKLLKAENRTPKALGRSFYYSFSGTDMVIDDKKEVSTLYDIGTAVKNFRKNQAMSQKDLSRLVGVTPSNISQIESNQVFPSIPALFKIAEHLSVDVGSFFKQGNLSEKIVFHKAENLHVHPQSANKKAIEIKQLTPFDLNGKASIYLVDIHPNSRLSSHFFRHKGEEAGVVLSGKARMVVEDQTYELIDGDTIYLKTTSPGAWHNLDENPLKLLWVTLK